MTNNSRIAPEPLTLALVSLVIIVAIVGIVAIVLGSTLPAFNERNAAGSAKITIGKGDVQQNALGMHATLQHRSTVGSATTAPVETIKQKVVENALTEDNSKGVRRTKVE